MLRGLVVFIQALFVLGLRILGQKMSDPYGDDLLDLSVMFYVHATWIGSNRILNSHFPEEASKAVEQRLALQREEPIGMAWEPEKTAFVAKQQECGGEETFYDAVDLEATMADRTQNIILNPHVESTRNILLDSTKKSS